MKIRYSETIDLVNNTSVKKGSRLLFNVYERIDTLKLENAF